MQPRTRKRRSVVFGVLSTIALCVLPLPALGDSPTRGFIENLGQIDSAVRFYAVGDRSAVYFTAAGPVIEIREASEPVADYPTRLREHRTLARARSVAMAIRFVEPLPTATIVGTDRLDVRHNYLSGAAPERWHVNLPEYERVLYRDVWPGIDLSYRITRTGLVYEILARPGADRAVARFRYEGVRDVESTGGVHALATPLGTIEDRPPLTGAGIGEVRLAEAESLLTGSEEPAAGSYTDEDPVLGLDLWWSTFLGGTRDDAVYSAVVDDGAQVIVTGTTLSTDFPTTLGVVQPDYDSSFDLFVSKFSYDGSTLLWSTYLGGSNDDRGWAIGIDAAGQPVVAGISSSPDYPVTAGAYDTTQNGDYDAVVSKLSADGTALVFSSYYGGAGREWDVSGLDVDAAGRPVFSGSTRSADLPTSTGAYGTTLGGAQDAFVAALSADGSSLAFGTYLGGAALDVGEDVVLDSADRPLVVGHTSSVDFPTTAGALQTTHGGARDAFVTKLAADAGALVFSTYLGGTGDDDGYAVVLDAAEGALLTGATTSADFPVTAGAFATGYSGGRDIFVTRLTADGASQVWGTYFGGSFEERGLDIVEDSAGRPIFVGWTCSSDFPLAGPPLNDTHFTCDGYLSRLDPEGAVALYSSYIGGWRDDSVYTVAIGELDRLVAGGETFSTNFPTTSNAFDQDHNSPNEWYDAFVLDMLTPLYCTYVSGTTDPLLSIGKAVDGNCPDGTPEGQLIDVVEGHLENLDPVDVGAVWRIVCNSPDVVFAGDVSPLPGLGLFQMARFKPDGTYSDGAETGLVGDRTIVAGDCP